jgi:hypothetical protein
MRAWLASDFETVAIEARVILLECISQRGAHVEPLSAVVATCWVGCLKRSRNGLIVSSAKGAHACTCRMRVMTERRSTRKLFATFSAAANLFTGRLVISIQVLPAAQ